MRTAILGLSVTVALAGCGAQIRVEQLKPAPPSEAKNLLRAIEPVCNKPGLVLIRYTSPVVHGKGSDSWWCVEQAEAYRAVSRSLHCPAQTRLTINFKRRVATCKQIGSS
jgi:hypothetical protein